MVSFLEQERIRSINTGGVKDQITLPKFTSGFEFTTLKLQIEKILKATVAVNKNIFLMHSVTIL